MVTKEEIITYMEQQAVRPLSEAELAEQLGVDTVEDLVRLKKLLQEMENDGTLVLSRKKRYGRPEQFNLLLGKISADEGMRRPSGLGKHTPEG